uniref:Peptidase S54 rhomboid domain-containing protein n=1 Tax=Caenorhabditis angaria TaxID=860376 RepID=B6VBT3_9PELO|nr:hypothetical protein Csp3_JD02.004 [Caenorhabditis angaria]
MFARNPNGPFLGASGGDYALLFAHVSNLILNWKDMPYRRVQAFLVTSYVLSDFVEDSYSIVKYKVSRIAHGAHLNSAITGLIYGFFVLYYVEIVIHFYYQFNNDNSTILDQCAFDPEKRKEIWRFLTHSLLHHGIDHLAKNMVAQIFIGIPLEIAHRITKIGPIYVLGIICTAIMNHAIYPEVHSVGASCGDYALVFVHVSNLILHWSQIPYHKTQALILFIYVGSDFTDLFYRFASTEEVEIAHFAHFAAAIIGLLYGFFILYYVKKGILWSILRVVSLVSYILAVLYACVYAYNTNIEEIFAKEHRDQL